MVHRRRASSTWCRRGPITSLFPAPRATAPDDEGLRVFLSFGHLQMMLDAMPRLALEVWQLFLPAGKDQRADVARAAPR